VSQLCPKDSTLCRPAISCSWSGTPPACRSTGATRAPPATPGPSSPHAPTCNDDSGQVIVAHFVGPTWQAKDRGSVKAARADGVTVDPSDIPWLLLKATSATAGPDGDRLAGTTYIQRLATHGGIAPAAGQCNATRVGEVVEVPYTAEYYFWKQLAA